MKVDTSFVNSGNVCMPIRIRKNHFIMAWRATYGQLDFILICHYVLALVLCTLVGVSYPIVTPIAQSLSALVTCQIVTLIVSAVHIHEAMSRIGLTIPRGEGLTHAVESFYTADAIDVNGPTQAHVHAYCVCFTLFVIRCVLMEPDPTVLFHHLPLLIPVCIPVLITLSYIVAIVGVLLFNCVVVCVGCVSTCFTRMCRIL